MKNKEHNHNEEAENTCGCGCGCDDMEDSDIVELVDDEGNSVKFTHVATIDYENEWYVFFSPAEEVDGLTSEEVVIFKLDSDEEGKDVFSPIEDEELLNKVYEEYLNVLEEDGEESDEDYEEEDDEDGHEGGCSGCTGCCG